ncbi:MAG: hypothetical protein Q8936_21995 [Bacillota bacterium]|nr:hypothetical protein [Bacillota bacterium]
MSELVKALQQRIKELEESCQNLAEIETNLHERIRKLQDETNHWMARCEELETMYGCNEG